MQRALVAGNFELAVEACFKTNRLADAVLIATVYIFNRCVCICEIAGQCVLDVRRVQRHVLKALRMHCSSPEHLEKVCEHVWKRTAVCVGCEPVECPGHSGKPTHGATNTVYTATWQGIESL